MVYCWITTLLWTCSTEECACSKEWCRQKLRHRKLDYCLSRPTGTLQILSTLWTREQLLSVSSTTFITLTLCELLSFKHYRSCMNNYCRKENPIIMSSLHNNNLKFSFCKYFGNFQKSLSKAVDVRSGKILIPSNNHILYLPIWKELYRGMLLVVEEEKGFGLCD